MPTKCGHRPPQRQWQTATFALALISAAIWTANTSPSDAGGTKVKHGTANRVFVMAGFKQEGCAFLGYPDMQLDTQPAKGAVSFQQGETTTVQYSLSGNCIGTAVQGTGIYYTPAAGQSGEDSFTVTGRLGTGEPATRTFSVIIGENGSIEEINR